MNRRNQTGDSFFAWDGDTLIVNILGRPGAPRDALGPVHGQALRVSVRAAPEAGQATRHMLRFLAPLFGVPVSRIELVYGRESVHKQIRVHAPTRLPDVFGPLPPQA